MPSSPCWLFDFILSVDRFAAHCSVCLAKILLEFLNAAFLRKQMLFMSRWLHSASMHTIQSRRMHKWNERGTEKQQDIANASPKRSIQLQLVLCAMISSLAIGRHRCRRRRRRFVHFSHFDLGIDMFVFAYAIAMRPINQRSPVCASFIYFTFIWPLEWILCLGLLVLFRIYVLWCWHFRWINKITFFFASSLSSPSSLAAIDGNIVRQKRGK